MKLLLLFSGLALSVSLAAQYPSSGIKSRLGWQTTGDGLVYRGSGAPAYSPGTMFNAWMYLDTTNYTLYMYRNFQWTKLPLVNNGLTLDGSYVQLGGSLVENTTVSTGTYDLLLGRTSGTNHAWINIYGSGGYAGLFNSYNSGALEAEITAGGGTASLLVENITDGGNSSIYVTKDGFQASYLHPVIGASFFKMDSTKFRIRGLVSYASHSAADAANTEYQLYQINNSRAVYVKNGATTSQDILGTGTTNRVPLWTATNTLGNSNIQDNNTAISILNSKPFQLGQWTTAGRPTGTSGYMGWNTTLTGIDWYNGTRWATGLESTFARGTATRIPFFDANGQVTESANMVADISNNRYYFSGTSNAGTNTLTSSTGLRLELRTSDNTSNAGGFIAFGSQFGTGAAIKYIHVSGAGNTSGGISFYTRENTADATLTRQITLAESGAVTFAKSLTLLGDFTAGRVRINNFNAGGPGIFGNITEGVLSNGNYQNTQPAIKLDFLNGNFDFQTAPSGTVGTPVTLTSRMYLTNTGLLRLGGTATTSYQLDVQGTNAIGLPRGTVAQRPTIVSSTTPIRFNTDSTALEYGESVGTWRQIATRAYARSLVSGLGTGTVTSVGLSLPSIFSVSGSPVTTSGTLSASFTGGSSSQFLRGDGTWSKKMVKEAGDSIIFHSPGIFSGPGASMIIYGDDNGGYNSYHERSDYGYTYNYVYTNGFNDESRLYLGSARGTNSAPTSLIKQDRIGGLYFHAYGSGQFNKTAVIRAEIDSIYSGDKPMAKIIFGVDENNNAETSPNWRFLIKNERNVSVLDHVVGLNMGIGLTQSETVTIESRLHVKGTGTTTGKTLLLEDSGGADILTITDNKTIQAHGYATPATTAAALGKTQSNYAAGFATDGTVTSLEVKRDTTIFVTADTDYDFSAAVTTAQISRRYNRIIIHMTLTSGASADKTTTLHTPDANLMQCEFVIRGTDNNVSHTNDINFGTNNAISSDGTNASGYTLSAGQGLHVRVVYNGSAYKYIYY